MRAASLVAWFTAAVLSCACARRATEPATPPAAAARPPTVAEIVARARAAVAVIETDDGVGTGFVIEPGLLATNLHVIAGTRSVKVSFDDGAKATVESVVAIDPDHDLALLATPDPPPPRAPLTLGDDTRLRAGDGVVAVGTPQGLELTASTGIVGAVRQINPGLTLLQITAPISPGSSGGPLFDEKGEVVGVTTLIMRRGQNLNFAVPARYVRALLARPRQIIPLASRPSAEQKSHFDTPTTHVPFPDAVAGFEIGSTFDAVKEACPKARSAKGVLDCPRARVPVPFATGRVLLLFAEGRLASVRLVATTLEDAVHVLSRKYGKPRPSTDTVRGTDIRLRWAFHEGASITVERQTNGRVSVLYIAPVWNAESNY